MTKHEDDKMQSEIAAGEAWLAEALRQFPEPTCASLENIKHHVRIEAHEQAIALGDAPPLRPVVLEQIKRTVRQELAARPVHAARQVGRRSWWLRHRLQVGTMAAAAAVAVVLTPLWWPSGEMLDRGSGIPSEHGVAVPDEADRVAQAWDDFASVLADTSELETELSALDSAIESLGDTAAWPTEWFDELDGDMQQGAAEAVSEAYEA